MYQALQTGSITEPFTALLTLMIFTDVISVVSVISISKHKKRHLIIIVLLNIFIILILVFGILILKKNYPTFPGGCDGSLISTC